ncbi:MAG: deoxyuridine 5'-triphosphate nucleotidohydrolase [Pseudomonas sp. PGPPP3]|nr:MAG: deoxyuridine 5'-triphosphate nucleotidohydrolase [Pseudomonas sp. PGPPP3]
MNFTMRFKLASLLAVFGILISGLTGYYSYSNSRTMLINAAERDLLTATQVLGRSLQASLASASQDVRLLASLPQTRQLSGQLTASPVAHDELAATFGSLLNVHPEYLQIRLIGLAEHGKERVRVERDGKKITRVEGLQLQEKAHFPYVFKALDLKPGQVRLSPIVINHEQGAHSGLDKPTLTISGPSDTGSASISDLIVLNIDLNKLFKQLKADLPAQYEVYLSNEAGDILIHPDSSLTFGFDRGQRILLQSYFAPVGSLLDGSRTTVVTTSLDHANADRELISAFVRLPLDDDAGERQVILGLSQPADFIVRDIGTLGWSIATIVAVLSLLSLLLSTLAARALTRPLHDMMHAIQRFSKDRTVSPLPLRRRDELGQLARSFQEMQQEIVEHLNQLNESRNALDHLAQHDPLTGLPNRRMFFERLQQAIANARRTHQPLALLFIDLDYFKEINDNHGHALGAEVLKAVARLLSSATREVDTVARLGGDEFVILFNVLEEPQDIQRVVHKLHERFQSPLRIDGLALNVRASIGVSRYPEDGDSAERLMQHADRAMYAAKNDGRNTFAFHDSSTSQSE